MRFEVNIKWLSFKIRYWKPLKAQRIDDNIIQSRFAKLSEGFPAPVLLSTPISPVTLALEGVEVAENVGLVQRRYCHHHEVPEQQNAAKPLVHLPVVGVRGADEEHHSCEQSQGGVEDALIIVIFIFTVFVIVIVITHLVQHLHCGPGGDHTGLQEPGEP